MNNYVILTIILFLLLLFFVQKEHFTTPKRKQMKEAINDIKEGQKCVDTSDSCDSRKDDSNVFTPPGSTGQITSFTQTDCDNPLNPEAEARMWLNCCGTCSKRVENTPRASQCNDLLGLDENGESICSNFTKKMGCNDLLDVVCCETCSKLNTPKILIDKNIKINENVVLHENNFNQRTDLNNQATNVLKYASPQDMNVIKGDEDADIYFKERDTGGITFSYNSGKIPSVYLDTVEMNGDILNDILKYRTPYLKSLYEDDENDYGTIHDYEIYDSTRRYKELCFDNRSKSGDGNDICITSDHLKMLNGQRDIKIKDSYKNCLSTTPFQFKESGRHYHHFKENEDSPGNKNRNILFFGSCDTNNRNRFKIENIKEIKSKIKLV